MHRQSFLGETKSQADITEVLFPAKKKPNRESPFFAYPPVVLAGRRWCSVA